MSSRTLDPPDSLCQASREETFESTGDLLEDWRVKACEILESYIKEIRKRNDELVTETAALTHCLYDELNDLIRLSHDSDQSQLDQEKFIHYLSELSELHPDLDSEMNSANLLPSPILSLSKVDLPVSHNRSISKSDRSRSIDIQEDDGDDESPTSYSKFTKRPYNAPTRPKKSQDGHFAQSRTKPEPMQPVAQSKPSVQVEEDDSDTEFIRTAFRLFAKHIGPSLKREHRMMFNSPPTQAWLADQLLTRWDGLDPRERQNWLRRVHNQLDE